VLNWSEIANFDPEPAAEEAPGPEDKTLREAKAGFEKQFILKVLSENGGNISKTAQHIGIERSHLHKKIKAYGIDVSDQGGN
jgi:two-component system nitrogen regulation response regulator NtrX